MNMKLLGAFAGVALLAACSSTPAPKPAASTMSGPTPGSEEDFVQNVGDRIFFAFDSSAISDASQATLEKQAAWLAKYPSNNMLIAGNCDERGTEEYNLALGERRANADKDFLVAHGVAASRLSTISYGKDRPVALGHNPQAWAQNRNAITSVK